MQKPARVTVAIEGPFKIRPARSFVIKVDGRLPVACGEEIEDIKATAGLRGVSQELPMLVDGVGLSLWDDDLLIECDNVSEQMWMSPDAGAVDFLEFDLGGPQVLSCAQVWNYNVSDATQQGLGRADVSVWTEAKGWTTVLRGVTFAQAEGTRDYDEPTVLALDGITAAKVRFDHLQGLEIDGAVGLSEVQFFSQRTNEAAKPYPTHDSQVIWKSSLPIHWTSGLDVITQKVYLGLTPSDLTEVATIDREGFCAGTLEGCSSESRYYWRVDTVHKDGSVTPGPLWQFDTSPVMVGHWTFDESQGTVAHDQSSQELHATVAGEIDWRPDQGKVGGALMLDGTPTSYVDLPNAVGSGPGGKTLALWAYPTASKRWARFIEFGNGENQDNILFSRFVFSDDLLLSTYRESAGGGRVYARGAIDPNAWQFLAVTLDDKGNAKIYKNGKPVAEGFSGVVVRDVVRTENYIGRSNWSVDDNYQGLIDDVWIINTVLSDQEIQGLYQGHGYQPIEIEASLPQLVMAPVVVSEGGMSSEQIPSSPWSRLMILLVVVLGLILMGWKTRGRSPKA